MSDAPNPRAMRRARWLASPTPPVGSYRSSCTLNATKVTDTMAHMLGRSRDELEHLALECAPGAGGVVLLPYFDGERTPNLPDATGILAGLRSDTEPAQLARAAYEGVVCGLLDALDALRRRWRRRPTRAVSSSSAAARAPRCTRNWSPICSSGRSKCPRLPSTWHVVPASRPPLPRRTTTSRPSPTSGRRRDGRTGRARPNRRRREPSASQYRRPANAPIPNQETAT